MPPRLDEEARRRLSELKAEERRIRKAAQTPRKPTRAAVKRALAPTLPQRSLKGSRGRVIDKAHKGMIAQLFCLATAIRHGCEVYGVHVAHVRHSYPEPGWQNPGLQVKPDDWRTLPLRPDEHWKQHGMNEAAFYRDLSIYPPALCAELREVSPDVEKAKEILRRHVRAARMARGPKKVSTP